MRSNQKGFTLIELLAVIVILAIIALIATPVVLNIIDKARTSAAQDSVYGVMNSIRLAYTESLLDVNSIALPFEVTCSKAEGSDVGTCTYDDPSGSSEKVTLAFSGTAPTAGKFKLDSDGKFDPTTDIIVNGKYCSIAESSNTVSCSNTAPSAGEPSTGA